METITPTTLDDRCGLDTLTALQIAGKTTLASSAYNISRSDVDSKADRRQDYLSRRDEMKVAWQFIARDVCEKKTRPVGYGMIGFAIVLFRSTPVCELALLITPCLRHGPLIEDAFQAINCLATIIESLRDTTGKRTSGSSSLPIQRKGVAARRSSRRAALITLRRAKCLLRAGVSPHCAV